MKIKIMILSLLLVPILFATSCSDNFLSETNTYEYDESIFESETLTGEFIDAIYSDFFSGYNSPIKTLVGSYSTDRSYMTEEIGGTIMDWTNPSITYTSSANCPTYYGTKLSSKTANEPYTRIRYCNYIIEYINSLGSSLDATFRSQARGQMFMMRAMQYYDLMRVYGGVPIVTTVQSASSSDTTTQVPRATTSEVVTQICADLDSAANLLPATWTASTDYGRFTKGAALAEKSRVLLTYASPLFNEDWDNTSNSRWSAALAAGLAAESELSGDGYGLYGSSAKDWANMFLVDNAFCKEAIIVQMCSTGTTAAINNGWEKSIRLTSQGGGGGVAAPREMIDLFPLADGSRPTIANGYDTLHFYLNRDPRFYRTFAFNGCLWNYSGKTDTVWAYQYYRVVSTLYYSGSNQIKSPAFVRKMSNPSASSTSSFAYSGTDIFEYRYAELLLNIAECYAATGDISDCLTYLEKIRARVGIPSDNNYGIGTLSDKYAAIAACLYERQVELAYEGKRFWDIQRWMLYNDDSSDYNTTCAKLGLTPINGTARTGSYWRATTKITLTNTADPYLSKRRSIAIDPDASDFSAQLDTLAAFQDKYFTTVPPPTAMDYYSSTYPSVKIDWKENYYIFGLSSSVLTNNSWLKQTINWTDATGAAGTFDFRE